MPHLLSHLVEADILGLLTEALTAQVEVVLADQTSVVLADAAAENIIMLAFGSPFNGPPRGGAEDRSR
jgi:hypothetical protein